MHEIVVCPAFEWECPLQAVCLLKIANKANRTITGFSECASGYGELPVVIVDKDTISSDSVKPTILNRALAGSFGEDGASPVYGPVAKRWHIVTEHVGA